MRSWTFVRRSNVLPIIGCHSHVLPFKRAKRCFLFRYYDKAAFFDKTRFVADLGVAYFCLHHVYKNYKKGLYAQGASGRLRHIIVAGAVLAIAYNRLHAAYTTANGSSSATLHKLVAPLNTVLATLRGQQANLAGGAFDTGSFQRMYSTADSFGKTATSNGYLYHDISIPLPAGS